MGSAAVHLETDIYMQFLCNHPKRLLHFLVFFSCCVVFIFLVTVLDSFLISKMFGRE